MNFMPSVLTVVPVNTISSSLPGHRRPGLRFGPQQHFAHRTTVRTLDQIRQSLPVESFVKSVQRLTQHAFQSAASGEPAGVGGHVEALDDHGLSFRFAHQFADADFLRRTPEPDAAAATAPGVEIAELGQVVDHLDQMIARNAVGGGDFVHLKRLALQRGKHEDAQGVVAKEAQVHGSAAFKRPRVASAV